MSDFWARRKAAVAAEGVAEAQAADATLRAEEAALQEQKTDAELLEELGLPDPDTLELGADFKPFLNGAVPNRIKTRALRRLWRLNPVLANLDGLVDYGQDFTDSAMVVENLQTAYQVGKGMLAHVEALARKAEEAEAAEAEDDLAPDADPEPLALADVEQEVPDQVREEAAPEGEAPPVLEYEPEDAPAHAATTRRRMQFTFNTEEVA